MSEITRCKLGEAELYRVIQKAINHRNKKHEPEDLLTIFEIVIEKPKNFHEISLPVCNIERKVESTFLASKDIIV